jgi:hypothetical protein
MKRELVLEAIKGTGGIMSAIAKRLGCEWHTANTWCQKWVETQKALEDEREGILDLAENTVYQSIKDKDVQTAKWLLATKGKRRGYSERHEIDATVQGQIVIVRAPKE